MPPLWRAFRLALVASLYLVAAKKPPHILFVVMDDLGSHDLGLHNSGIHTPNSDDLARSGLYLWNYYVLPSCSPTRTAILSGRYPLHTGINNYIPPRSTTGLPLDEETLPQVLARAGYRRHAVGKWHIGSARWAQTPTFRGFESFYGFYGGGEDYYRHTFASGYDFRRDRREYCGEDCSEVVDERGRYSTHLFAREAAEIINDYDESEGKPLFLYLAFQAVHNPNQVPAEYIHPYADKNWTEMRKTYAGMLSAADEGIGNVTAALKAKGLWEDTLVAFTTDNGGPTETCAVQGSSNWPRRGGKCSVWEGGTTGDGFLSGPALAKLGISSDGERKGIQNLFHCVDWLPTLASVVGVEPAGKKLDGVNQLDALRGGKAAREEVYIGLTDSQIGIHGPALRYQKWKIIEGDGGKPGGWSPSPAPGFGNATAGAANVNLDEYRLQNGQSTTNKTTYLLFDLEADKAERHDIASQYPEVVAILKSKLEEYKASGVPQAQDDPSCPWTGLMPEPNVGPTWMPWCKGSSKVVVYS